MSTDRTLEICNDPSAPWAQKVRVLQRAWTGFKDQRNYSLEQARHDWILIVDGDEACTKELADRIQGLMGSEQEPEFRAYKVQRIEYLLGVPIRHGIWNPSYQDRFFHRAGVRYVNEVHEFPMFPRPPGMIHEPLLHDPANSPERILGKMNFYTTIEARDRVMQGQRTNWFHLIFTFPAMSFKNFVYYGAYKDGMPGLICSLLEGLSRTVRHIKMWQFQRELDEKKRSA